MRTIYEDVSANTKEPGLPGPAPVVQWVGLVLPPAAFLTHLQANYLLVMYVCGTTLGLTLVRIAAAAAILIAAAGCFAAWLTLRRSATQDPNDAAGAVPRTRLLGTVGLGVGGILLLLLVAQLIATFVVAPCE